MTFQAAAAALGIPLPIEGSDIKAWGADVLEPAWKAAATRLHPDKAGGDTAAFACVSAAHDVLSSEVRAECSGAYAERDQRARRARRARNAPPPMPVHTTCHPDGHITVERIYPRLHGRVVRYMANGAVHTVVG